MGKGYTWKCPQCEYSFSNCEGIGFLFPVVYEETIEKAKERKLGKTLKKFFEEHEDGTIDAERVTLCCDKCGNFSGAQDLTMYIPKYPVVKRRNYLMKWEIDYSYEKYADFPHKCGKCRGKMHVVKQDEDLICPECGATLEKIAALLWD